jgi:hypothetical protein
VQAEIAKDLAYHLDRRLDSLFQTVLSILSGGSVFTADKVTLDGTTGKMTSWVDWLDETHTLTQGTDALRSAAPGVDANLNGAKSVAFTGAQYYSSSRAASTWGYLHKGAGAFKLIVWVPDTNGGSAALNTLFGTYRGQDSGTVSGINVLYTTTTATGTLQVAVARASGTRTIDQTALVTQFSQNVPATMRMDYLEGASPEYTIRKLGVSIASGASGAAPSATDPQSTLVVGANPVSFDRKLTGRIAFMAFAPKVPTAGETQTIVDYIQQVYGVAA